MTARVLCLLISLGLLCLPARVRAETEFITLACTTSTENSGLLDRIFPHTYEHGVKITGQPEVLKWAERAIKHLKDEIVREGRRDDERDFGILR